MMVTNVNMFCPFTKSCYLSNFDSALIVTVNEDAFVVIRLFHAKSNSFWTSITEWALTLHTGLVPPKTGKNEVKAIWLRRIRNMTIFIKIPKIYSTNFMCLATILTCVIFLKWSIVRWKDNWWGYTKISIFTPWPPWGTRSKVEKIPIDFSNFDV